MNIQTTRKWKHRGPISPLDSRESGPPSYLKHRGHREMIERTRGRRKRRRQKRKEEGREQRKLTKEQRTGEENNQDQAFGAHRKI